MRAISISTLLFALALALSGCGKNTDQQPGAPPEATTTTDSGEHAPAGALPGSHEDWCGGHAVPESLCTRCNPSLIPAFQATGDWCAQHSLPESQCFACNPNLVIERPPKTVNATP